MTKFWIFVFAALAAVGCGNKPATERPAEKPISKPPKAEKPTSDTYRINPLRSLAVISAAVNGHKLRLYVADTPEKEQEGLMFVTAEELGPDDGMIFVFDAPSQQSFWMKNTLIPLDIAYLDSKGKIINILTMSALDESSYPSEGPASYAVELNADWFKNHAVKPGDRFDLSALHAPH
jgi:uncharacterized membrane protein (UPF0127 family)